MVDSRPDPHIQLEMAALDESWDWETAQSEYAEKNLYNQVVEAFKQLGDAPHALGHLGNLYARHGASKEALGLAATLKERVSKTGIGRYEIALIYAGLHNNGEAFEWLNQALKSHDKGILYIKIDPCLDPLRFDPRFAELLRSARFPAESMREESNRQ